MAGPSYNFPIPPFNQELGPQGPQGFQGPQGHQGVQGPQGTIPEEGVFTPQVSFTTPGNFSPSYSLQEGSYQKEGQRVDFSFRITWTANNYSGASGQIVFTGLPYQPSGTFRHLFMVDLVTNALPWPNSNTQVFAVFITSTQIAFRSMGSNQNRSASWGITQFPPNEERAVVVSGFYFTNA